jgi:propanol-preferring alcohol dehydrogenase
MMRMRAMVLEKPGQRLELRNVPKPDPADDQILIRVLACGVCRTDLHIIDGELNEPKLPLILGHEIVGIIEQTGKQVHDLKIGDRVGVPWLGWTDGTCRFCRARRGNLCENARFTGYQIDGGYAEYTVADPRFCFPLPDDYPDAQAAPLLCAGLIGYRALRFCGEGDRLGLYGFGASAHIIAQVARHRGWQVYAFTRRGDDASQKFAKELGAVWAGASDEQPPDVLDAAILFAPAGSLVPEALRAVDKGGRVVCAGIHMSDIPSFPYELLWGERLVRSVANLTRRDGREFLRAAPEIPVHTEITEFPLEQANEAVRALREGRVQGAVVLRVAEK